MAPSATFTEAPAAPPTVVGPTTKGATRPTNKLPDWLIEEARVPEKVPFDAKKHINYEPPKRIYTMSDIGLSGRGVSETAASEPFPLFTPEAIEQVRAEIFSEPVLATSQYASSFAKNMIRGYGPKLAPFIFSAWYSPEVLNAVSSIAGIELIPAYDWECGHINITINKGIDEAEDDNVGFSWHWDSYPFVCVTMLSDCTGMSGGETAMRTGTGEVMKVRGPAMGTAVVMQGRYIEHAALKAFGGRERISMVTAFRPKNPLVKDEIVLTGSRNISDLSSIYYQYSVYRTEVLEERLRSLAKKLRQGQHIGRPFETRDVRSFLTEQKVFIESMLADLI